MSSSGLTTRIELLLLRDGHLLSLWQPGAIHEVGAVRLERTPEAVLHTLERWLEAPIAHAIELSVKSAQAALLTFRSASTSLVLSCAATVVGATFQPPFTLRDPEPFTTPAADSTQVCRTRAASGEQLAELRAAAS